MSKVLVAYDGSDESKRALDRAAALGGENEITVISVVPVHQGVGSGRGGGIDPTDTVSDHRTMLDEARAALAAKGVTAHVVEAVGHPAETIVQVAEDEGYDLIVVGSRGLGAVKRFVSGSVSGRVVTHAHCDVLVVR